MKNKFLIDLSTVDLTEEEISKIKSALEKAVTTELAHRKFKNKIALEPLETDRGIGGPGGGGETMGFRSVDDHGRN
jgi:hypothetical protein